MEARTNPIHCVMLPFRRVSPPSPIHHSHTPVLQTGADGVAGLVGAYLYIRTHAPLRRARRLHRLKATRHADAAAHGLCTAHRSVHIRICTPWLADKPLA
jgi:hypothetical protein